MRYDVLQEMLENDDEPESKKSKPSKMISDKEVGDKKPSSAKILAGNNGYKKAPKSSIVNMLEQGGCE